MTLLFAGARASLLFCALSAAVLVPNSCASRDQKKQAIAGSWGGQHIALEISANGADLELDCAHGHIAQAMVLDKNGKFDLHGTYSQEHGGPVLKDETPKSDPARYSGHVDGDTMTITITRGNDQIGPYELTRGTPATLRKCR